MSSEVSVVYTAEKIYSDLASGTCSGNTVLLKRSTKAVGEPSVEAVRPKALLVMLSDEAESVKRELSSAGFEIFVACADDAKPALAGVSFASLGACNKKGILGNAFAVSAAARGCSADVVLLGEEASCLRQVDNFLAQMAELCVNVFCREAIGGRHIGWALCLTDKVHVNPVNWKTCPSCKLTFDALSVEADHYVCPACGALMRENSLERIRECFDDGVFTEWDIHVEETDPLGFPGYLDKIAGLKERTGFDEAVKTGVATIWGIPFAFGIMDSSFLMGSMGSVVGEKITRMVRRATKYQLPVVIFSASGGARMQEGLVSLMQMAKTSCAISEHGDAGLPYFSVLTDPTTGGVTASFAMQGDVIIAEPGALIGFAGRRVIKDTIKQDLPDGFQSAEFALEHGLIDMICPRQDLRRTLGSLLALHDKDAGVVGMVSDACVDDGYRAEVEAYYERTSMDELSLLREKYASEKERAILGSSFKEALIERDKAFAKDGGVSAGSDDDNRAWRSVKLARNVHRPTAQRYISAFADSFVELHGDRMFADDGAVVCGIGSIDDIPVTIVGLEKGSDLRERIARNFGCAQPEGYRKSFRLIKQAEKFGRPVVCIVDTQGAFCGMEAEERGQGNAIADNLLMLAGLKVPVISVVVGEGGSGGALALALANRVAMQKNAIYSVLSPEGFASILWKDGSRAAEAAAVMKMSAREIYDMGLIERVLDEGTAAHEEPEVAVAAVKEFVVDSLRELVNLSPEEIVRQRRERFFAF